MSTNPAWDKFLEGYKDHKYGESFRTFEGDYQECKKDSEAGVPRAVEFMTAFAKFRLKS